MTDRSRTTRLLLLSAYRADSHAAWSDWLTAAFADVHWQTLELPGRNFRWRIRGNPLSWLDALDPLTADALVATSMVDLATLRGLHPALARLPTLYYFHENQFAYPLGAHQARSIEPQMVQLYGALAADRLGFNSRFNLESFLDGVQRLLRRMPDAVPARVPERLAAKAEVLPVPVRPPAPAEAPRDPRLVLWNHRWEYDKAPELFAEALLALADRGVSFRLALLGARPEQPPAPLVRLREQLGGRIVADGKVARPQYAALLRRAGIVVSTALHEFQGLAMLEAVSAGAVPLVPDDLVYPEQYPPACRYPARDGAALAQRLQSWLEGTPPPAPDVRAWTEAALAGQWRSALAALTGDSPDSRSR
ncbi:MAG: tRNA-queuosine alpha-mannosyltransferase domain-containing protein [Pseudomonadota bacterium]